MWIRFIKAGTHCPAQIQPGMLHWSRCRPLPRQPQTPQSCGAQRRSGREGWWYHRTWDKVYTLRFKHWGEDYWSCCGVCLSLTFPALSLLQCRHCHAPPRNQTRIHPASPGWSSWSSVWWHDPPQQINTICTADGNQWGERQGLAVSQFSACALQCNVVKDVPAGEDNSWGGLDSTGNQMARSPAHHILQKGNRVRQRQCAMWTSSAWPHLCVYGCSLPHLFGRGSLDDRHTQTQAADSDRCHTWTLLWSSSLRKHTVVPHTDTHECERAWVHVLHNT